MIERIEGLEAKFERLAFGQFGDLMKRYVPIVDTRSIEWPPRSVSLHAKSVRGEQGRIEIWLPIAWIVIDLQIPRRHVRQVEANRVDAVVLCQ